MALPSSGPLSINDIRVELGASDTNQSLGAFSDTAGFTAPDAITDFYGYSNLPFIAFRYRGPGKQGLVCNTTTTQGYFQRTSGGGTQNIPTTGDTCYQSNQSTVLTNGWYAVFPGTSDGDPFSQIEISGGAGVVVGGDLCGL